jgi:protein transport protein SEC20
LEQEVSRSRFAQEIFDQSNEELKNLSTQYTDLDGLLAASKGLVGSLLTSTKSDTWYLETTVWLLVATCSWLFFRRILYGPTWWLVWLPLKLLWKFSITTLGILGVFSSKEVKVLTDIQLNQTASAMSSGISHIAGEQADYQDQDSTNKANPSEGSEVERVGQIADESEQKEERYRGDGTKLVKSDAPRNPKKRVLNEEPTDMNNQGTPAENEEKKDKDEL